MNSQVSCIIPVYNEPLEVVHNTIRELKQGFAAANHDAFEIIVVNDGSDPAFDYQSIATQDRCCLIRYRTNRGYGGAIKEGMLHAQGDWILITDADGTYPNRDVGQFLSRADENEMLIGLRIPEQGAVPLTKRIAKGILKFLASRVTGKSIPDLNSGMRLFKKELGMEYYHLYPNGFSLTTTITVAAMNDDRDVEFIPIPYAKRMGKSKISVLDFISFLVLIARMLTYFKPLHVFLPISLFLMLLSGIKLGIDYTQQGHLGIGAGLIFLASFQLMLNGFIADAMISYSRRR
ncbi:MAG: glycosyltransferase family 2 protein [Puniceicoccaceae bacterium]